MLGGSEPLACCGCLEAGWPAYHPGERPRRGGLGKGVVCIDEGEWAKDVVV